MWESTKFYDIRFANSIVLEDLFVLELTDLTPLLFALPSWIFEYHVCFEYFL